MPTWTRPWLALGLALACLAGGGTGVWAEDHGTRVAIIEMARIIEESTAIRSIRIQGEARRRANAEDTQRVAERLGAVRAELLRQESLLEPAALEERTRAFNAEVAAADRRAQVRNLALQRALDEGETRFRHALDDAVAEVAQRQGFELVLPVHASLFAVAEFNLTDFVLERLNESVPEIVLTFDDG